MKRLLISVVLALSAFGLFGQPAADRDVLVAPGGTIYTIETVQVDEPSSKVQANYMLSLSVQDGDNVARTIVPASTTPGTHWRATLAYDSESQTLFVLWLHMPNAMSSELLLAAYQDGKWQQAVSIDDKPYDLRYNLKIGITRRVAQLQNDGTYADVPALVLHAVWWDETGAGEQARYALISIDKGALSSVDIHDLSEFVDAGDPAAAVDPTFNAQLLKHPTILDGPSTNSVDVVFANAQTNVFHRITLRPVLETRIHIPVGRSIGGGPTFAAPGMFNAEWSGSVTTLMSSRDRDKLVFCNTTGAGVTYLVHSANGWSETKTIPTSQSLSAEAAIAALQKMISNE
ncbi:MAG: hypothetical protein ACXVJO_14955 [Thermoanaerobaculia bacterium]